jgi:hypothetical protein
MAADGVALSLPKIGADRLHATIDQAVEAHRRDGRPEGVA